MNQQIKTLIIFISIIVFSNSNKIIAQNPKINLEDLQAPTMPSATIIGTQVNEVSKPKSLKALEAAILTNYLDSDYNLSIPNNFALEFNPFMLSGRKNFNYESYLDSNIFSNMWRNLSLSVSSTTEFLINDSVSSNAMGFGIRTILLNGKVNSELKTAFTSAIQKNTDVLNVATKVRTLISYFIQNNENISIDDIRSFVLIELEKDDELKKPKNKNGQELSNHYIILAKNKEIINSVFDKIPRETVLDSIEYVFKRIYDNNISDDALTELQNTLYEIKHNRYGWRLDLNYAQATSFPTNEFDFSYTPRCGLWVNISWKPATIKDKTKKNGTLVTKGTPTDIQFIGLARILWNNDKFINNYSPADTTFKTGNIYDLGARIVYEIKRFSIEFEYIHRFNKNKITRTIDGEEYSKTVTNDSKKYVLNINYNISDNIILSYNIGKGYENIANTGGNLISGLSLNLGFGNFKVDELIND